MLLTTNPEHFRFPDREGWCRWLLEAHSAKGQVWQGLGYMNWTVTLAENLGEVFITLPVGSQCLRERSVCEVGVHPVTTFVCRLA